MDTMIQLASRCMTRFGCGRGAGICSWGSGSAMRGKFWLPMVGMGLAMLTFWVLFLAGSIWLIASLIQLAH